MHDEQADQVDKVADIVRNTHYQLWQALLTINGFLIAASFTILSISSTLHINLRIALCFLLCFLFLSCTILIMNFINFRAMYNIMYTDLYHGILPSENERKERLELATKKHNAVMFMEKLNLVIQAFVALMLLIIPFCLT